MAGRLTSTDPTVSENLRVVVSTALGSRRGQPVSILQAFDSIMVVGALGLMASGLAAVVRRRIRH